MDEHRIRDHAGRIGIVLMNVVLFFKAGPAKHSEDLATWSTPKLTEVMALLIDQLGHPAGTARERMRIRAEIDRIVKQIERRKLGE
jgi:hypothetical protein